MGLDQYLNKKIYIGNQYRKPEEKTKVVSPDGHVKEDKVKYIIEEAGYWRKANAIHNWFVKHVQGGEDDCKEYYVSHDDLAELLETVKKVLKSSPLVDGTINNGYSFVDGIKTYNTSEGKVMKDPSEAQRLLPTTEGFFFGSTDYDEWYVKDLEATVKILEDALADENADYYYQSSW
jgi:hypothetical protein